MVAQYYYGKDHADDAEVQYQKGIFGPKLVLSYIRAYCPPSHLFVSKSFCISLHVIYHEEDWRVFR